MWLGVRAGLYHKISIKALAKLITKLYQMHLDGKQKKQKILDKFFLAYLEGHISHRKFTEAIFQ